MQGRRAWKNGPDHSSRRPPRLRGTGSTPFPRHDLVPYAEPKLHQCLMYRTHHLQCLTTKEDCGRLVPQRSIKGSLTWFCRTGEAMAKARDGHLGCVLPYHRRPSAASRRAFRCLLLNPRTPHGRRNPWSLDHDRRAPEEERLPTLSAARLLHWHHSHRPRISPCALAPDRPENAPARHSRLLGTWETELRSREGSDGETKGR